jgi:hypothetical protein
LGREQLTPFVTRKMPPTRGRFEGDPKGALSGAAYLAKWKAENMEDPERIEVPQEDGEAKS